MKKWLVVLLIFIVACSEKIIHSEGNSVDLMSECNKLNGILCKQNEFCTENVLFERCCSNICQNVKSDFLFENVVEDFGYCKIINNSCSDGSCNVIIVVDNEIFSNLTYELYRWKQDITNDLNVQVEFLNYSQNVLPFQIRSDIMKYYDQKIKGVIFVGDIPSMFFGEGYLGEIFPSDLYYVDFNGFCLDEFAVVPEQNYSEGSTPLYTESKYYFYRGINEECDKNSQIFLKSFWSGRIKPGNDKLSSLKRYFDRNHDFRTDKLFYNKSLLAYYPIVFDRLNEKDYKQFADFRISELYNESDVFIVPLDKNEYSGFEERNPSDISASARIYLDELKKSYEFVYYDGHGFPVSHQPNINYTNIKDVGSNAFFYDLNSCSVGRFTASNYIGGEYLFSGNGLVAFSATTPVYSAGPQINEMTSLALSHGLTFGDIYQLFIQNTAAHVLGDPTLRMRQSIKSSVKACISDLFLDFGKIKKKERLDKTVKIYNIGNETLRILYSFTKSLPLSDLNTFISPWNCKGEIYSKGTLNCSFTSQGLERGFYEGFILLITNDVNNQIIKIKYKGEVV